MRRKWIFLQALASALLVRAEAPVDYCYLAGAADPKRWSPAECETSVSPRTAWEHPAVRMHIPVDFSAGEKEYPIGWPRMYLSLQPDEQAWQAYDRFEFQLFTEASRTNLPKHPLTFHVYNAQSQQRLFPMDFAAIGTSKTFTVNISDLGLAGNITRLGFNINESDYADKDVIDFHLGGFRLVRGTVAQVTELTAVAPVLFCDSRVLPVELVVEGPPDKLAAGIPIQLRSGDRVVFTQPVPVTRGRQTVYLPLKETKLEPGAYTLIVCPDSPEARKDVTVTIVSSPYRSVDIPVRD